MTRNDDTASERTESGARGGVEVQAEKGSNCYVVRIHLQPPTLMSQFVQNSLECEVISNPSNRAIPYVVGKNTKRNFYKMKRQREETGVGRRARSEWERAELESA